MTDTKQSHPALQELKQGTHHLCACAATKKGPFCDGSHKGTGIVPVKLEVAEEKKTVALCNCGRSANMPYCDGSHKGL